MGFEKSTEAIMENGEKRVNVIDDFSEPPKNTCCPSFLSWLGLRHFVTFMLFLGMANAYVMRTNMSVAIVAMVNHTAIHNDDNATTSECGGTWDNTPNPEEDGEYVWTSDQQGYILSAFFYGYVITQIPFGILAKKYGNIYFLGIGMMINSVFAFLVPIAAEHGAIWLAVCRFIQGLGEGPIVPCTHALLAKWIPPNERSRMGAFVYAGAQFGTVISMPLSGLLSDSSAGWPSVFYVFGAASTVWSAAFLLFIRESPEDDKRISDEERDYIMAKIWGSNKITMPPIPWKSIFTSMPFWAILVAHMGHNYGYETLMTELPTYLKQVLHYDLKKSGWTSALPYLAMWIWSMIISHVADWMLNKKSWSLTLVRKLLNSIGQFSPAIALITMSFTGCNDILTVAILTIGVGLNGSIYSGFKINHLDISPRFAGILMSFTNCLANLCGLLAPIAAGNIVKDDQSHGRWAIVLCIAGGVYAVVGTFYLIFASGERQPWDNPDNDDIPKRKSISSSESSHPRASVNSNVITTHT
jgi:ACS family sodium-dependent inorganic phosphate cotransporter-like MFS transporter 5